MAPTVDTLRNEIRTAVGRHERVEQTGFTKEALAAVCEALGIEIDDGRLPPKSDMRTAIADRIDGLDTDEDTFDRAFRKAELVAIRDELAGE